VSWRSRLADRHEGVGESGREHGQATVEFALLLPVVFLLILSVLQVAVVALDVVLAAGAAREAVRSAAVDADPAAARRAGERSVLQSERLTVVMGPRGEPGDVVTVTATYRSATDLPLVGALIGDLTLRQTASMRVE